MSSAKGSRLFDTVKFRLAVFSVTVIAITILMAFLALYGYLSRALQANVDRALSSELGEFASIYRNGGMSALLQEVALEEVAHGKDRIFVRIFDDRGVALASSDLTHWGKSAEPPESVSKNTSYAVDSTFTPDGRTAIRRIYGSVGTGIFALIGVNNDHTAEVLATYRARCVEVFLASLVACVAGAWLIAQRAMRGVEALGAAAKQIDPSSLHRRIPVPGLGREIDELAVVLNEMLSRIAALVSESRILNDNIAHESRSPLTRIRGAAETILSNQDATEGSRELAGSIIEECDKLLAMINSMLAISELESGITSIGQAPADWSELVRETCELFLPAAEDSEITLRVETDSVLTVNGDRAHLQRVIANLLDNAIKYTRAHGTICVSVTGESNQAVLVVEDSGIGIAERDLPHVFDRFYRGDQSRSQPGNGLGLALVRAIVQVHNGDVDIARRPGGGTVCQVKLPLMQS